MHVLGVEKEKISNRGHLIMMTVERLEESLPEISVSLPMKIVGDFICQIDLL